MNLATSFWLSFSTLFFPSTSHAADYRLMALKSPSTFPSYLRAYFRSYSPLNAIIHARASWAREITAPLSLVKIQQKNFQIHLFFNILEGFCFRIGRDCFTRDSNVKKKWYKGFCCDSDSIAVKQFEEKKRAELARIKAERQELLTQPDIPLETLIEAVEGEGFCEEGLSQEVIQKRREAVHWIVRTMKHAGHLDQQATLCRDRLEHNLDVFLQPVHEEAAASSAQPQKNALNFLAQYTEYCKCTRSFTNHYVAESGWYEPIVEELKSPVKQHFQELVDQLKKSCQAYLDLIEQENSLKDPNLIQTCLQVLESKAEVDGFYLGLNLILDNIEMRLRRMAAIILERQDQAKRYLGFMQNQYRQLGDAARSANFNIVNDYIDVDIEPFRKEYKQFRREVYHQLWEEANQFCAAVQAHPPV